MALEQSQWVGASDDLVLTALAARLAGGAHWALNSANPLDVRTGLVFAGTPTLITGTAGLSVNLAPFHFLSSKATSNGPYLGTNKTTTPVTVPAAPSIGLKRIDLIWVRQEDKHATTGADAATLPTTGVVTGTASASPSKPALPAGSTEVGTVTWDSSSVVAAATNAAQCTLATSGPWTVARGCPIPVRNATERGTLTPFAGMRVTRLDAGGRLETYDGTGWLTEVYGMDLTVTTNASGEFAFASGLTTILFANLYNGNGGLVRGGRRGNITIARNSSGAAYVGGTITGIVFAANSNTAVASTTVQIDWMAKGYS